MDLIEELRRKLGGLGDHSRRGGIEAAIRHVEVAERYLTRGRLEQDPNLFNDVLYRTNQAFEGMLKEAYAVLTGHDASKLSPHAIEQLLLEQKKLGSRVLALFTNYRRDWRNPATHDHKLLFTEDEALLAIVSVAAFSVVLLNQIVEADSFKRERAEAEQRRSTPDGPVVVPSGTFEERILALLTSFSFDGREATATEAEIMGRLSGHIVGTDPSIEVVPQALLDEHYRADLLLKSKGETIVVEVKRARPTERLLSAVTAQVASYMHAASASIGVVYVVGNGTKMRTESREVGSGRKVWLLTTDDQVSPTAA